jgi:DNA invertase Pin-like site-specific DNA recombinase
MSPRVALYCRVSTSDQNSGAQLTDLREFSHRRNWTIVGEFTDEGVSGSKKSRPALDRLLAEARTRAFDAIAVYRYDRFARSLSHLVNALEEFRGLGIDFVSIHEGVDTSTPNGRLVFGIFASIAEFERELIRERTRSGMRNAKARGVHCGRKSSAAVDTRRVRELRAAGTSWDKIAKELGCCRATIQRRSGRVI